MSTDLALPPHPESVAMRTDYRAAPAPTIVVRSSTNVTASIVFMVIGATAYFIRTHGDDHRALAMSTAASGEAEATTPLEESREIHSTTAAQLYHSYEANEVATDRQIGNAIVEIRGTVKSIDKDMFDDPTIELSVGEEFSSVGLTMDKSELSVAASLSKGQAITARCDKVRRIIDHPIGEHCKIME
jgi:hypothetical protein